MAVKILLIGYEKDARGAWLRKQKLLGPEVLYVSETAPSALVSAMSQMSLLDDVSPLVIVCDTDASGRDACIAAVGTVSPSRDVVLALADVPQAAQKKMEKAGWAVEKSLTKKVASAKPDTFGMIRALERGDKKNAWLLYTNLIGAGVAAEMISGALLWSCKQAFVKPTPAAKRQSAYGLARQLVRATIASRTPGGVSLSEGIEKVILSMK